jgi:hypothetical protein
MLEYEVLQLLFQLMKSKKLPKKHWNDVFGWEMSEHIYAQILKVLIEGECDGSLILIN